MLANLNYLSFDIITQKIKEYIKTVNWFYPNIRTETIVNEAYLNY